MNKWIKETFY